MHPNFDETKRMFFVGRRRAKGVKAIAFYDSFRFDGYFIKYEAKKFLLYEVFALKRRSCSTKMIATHQPLTNDTQRLCRCINNIT